MSERYDKDLFNCRIKNYLKMMPKVSKKLKELLLNKKVEHTLLESLLESVCKRLMLDEYEIICWIKHLDEVDFTDFTDSDLVKIFYVGIWTKSELAMSEENRVINLI